MTDRSVSAMLIMCIVHMHHTYNASTCGSEDYCHYALTMHNLCMLRILFAQYYTWILILIIGMQMRYLPGCLINYIVPLLDWPWLLLEIKINIYYLLKLIEQLNVLVFTVIFAVYYFFIFNYSFLFLSNFVFLFDAEESSISVIHCLRRFYVAIFWL